RITSGAQAGRGTMRKLFAAAIGMVGSALCAGSALSHHSEAMFDPDKLVTIIGTVTQFEYTNPHVWLFVRARDETGTIWSFEAGSTSGLMRNGIKKNSLQSGDEVTVQAHPLRDGRPAGQWLAVTKSDGTVLMWRPGAVPATVPGAGPQRSP